LVGLKTLKGRFQVNCPLQEWWKNGYCKLKNKCLNLSKTSLPRPFQIFTKKKLANGLFLGLDKLFFVLGENNSKKHFNGLLHLKFIIKLNICLITSFRSVNWTSQTATAIQESTLMQRKTKQSHELSQIVELVKNGLTPAVRNTGGFHFIYTFSIVHIAIPAGLL
jgi:hypothetical protein